MKTISALFILFAVFTLASCGKFEKKDKEASFYYSPDFKNGEGKVLTIDVDEIDVLYTVFFYEGKDLKYKLVAEKSDENKVLAYEEGVANVDDNLNIVFVPESSASSSYSGYFENDKKNFKVTLPELENREINFVIKK